MEFNPLTIKTAIVNKKLSNSSNIFKTTKLADFSFNKGTEKLHQFCIFFLLHRRLNNTRDRSIFQKEEE